MENTSFAFSTVLTFILLPFIFFPLHLVPAFLGMYNFEKTHPSLSPRNQLVEESGSSQEKATYVR